MTLHKLERIKQQLNDPGYLDDAIDCIVEDAMEGRLVLHTAKERNDILTERVYTLLSLGYRKREIIRMMKLDERIYHNAEKRAYTEIKRGIRNSIKMERKLV